MKRATVPVVAIVAAALLVGLLAYGLIAHGTDNTLDQAVARGDRPVAPSRPLPLLGGQGTRSVADFKGKVVVLNFWASWCVPCRTEAPVLQKTQAKLASDGTGTVLGATFQDASPDSLSFEKDLKVSYPSIRDVGSNLAKSYGTSKIPDTFVINAAGKIVDLHRGQVDQAWLDAAIAKAQAPNTGTGNP